MIASDRNLVAHIYNPDNQTKEQLIDGFVVRLKQFQRVYKEISTDTMQYPEQHLLLEGSRGMGKTTMLLRLAYQIENDKNLNTWLIPLVFNEEEYGISRLFKLWERIAVLLEEKSAEFQGLFEEMDSHYDRYKTTEAYEYDMFALLSKKLETKGRKIILFIDNFGDIISKFKKQELQRLREVLQTSNKVRIIGASSVVLEAHYDYRHPFYEFFKIIRLRGLNQQETETLLLKLGEVYKQDIIKEIIETQKGRVEALRRLTGGVIRSIVLMFEIFVDKKDGSAFNDLEAILDKATPLYKHRMDDLPTQQQEIMQAIAMAWDAVNTKEISKITRIPSKTVSAQLRQLEKNELVQKILTSTKNHLYQVQERFFNIWYLMRHGRKGDKNRVRWLVRFLEEWCDKEELEERATAHIGALKAGTYDVRGTYFMSEAIDEENLEAQANFVNFNFLIKKQLNAALSYAKKYNKKNDTIEFKQIYAKLLVWNKNSIEAINIISSLWYQKNFIKNHENLLNEFLLTLLTNKYYTETYNYFTSEKAKPLSLKDRLKPMYYATLYFLKDKYPDEYLRMGDELKETVEEIIQKVEDLREEFKGLK